MIGQAQAREYLETILKHFEDELSEWEDLFCRDNLIRTKSDRPFLTERQREIIEQLMERCAQRHGKSRHDYDDRFSKEE